MYYVAVRFGVLLALPVALWVYFALAVGGGERFGYVYEERHGPVLYFAFVAVVVGAVALTAPVPVALNDSLFLPFAALVGGALYVLDRRFVAIRYGEVADATVPAFPWVVPILVGPVLEEYLYRAWLLPIATELDPLLYVPASAATFGLIHFYEGRHEIGLKTSNGLVYAGAYLLTGNLAVPICMHVGYNVGVVWTARRK